MFQSIWSDQLSERNLVPINLNRLLNVACLPSENVSQVSIHRRICADLFLENGWKIVQSISTVFLSWIHCFWHSELEQNKKVLNNNSAKQIQILCGEQIKNAFVMAFVISLRCGYLDSWTHPLQPRNPAPHHKPCAHQCIPHPNMCVDQTHTQELLQYKPVKDMNNWPISSICHRAVTFSNHKPKGTIKMCPAQTSQHKSKILWSKTSKCDQQGLPTYTYAKYAQCVLLVSKVRTTLAQQEPQQQHKDQGSECCKQRNTYLYVNAPPHQLPQEEKKSFSRFWLAN